MLESVLRRVLQAVFGSSADISPANPLPVTSIAAVVEHGTATGGTNVTLVDTTKDWAPRRWGSSFPELLAYCSRATSHGQRRRSSPWFDNLANCCTYC